MAVLLGCVAELLGVAFREEIVLAIDGAHLHRTEDEIFHILAGEFRMKIQDDEHRVDPGAIMLVPKGVPHTYRAESAQGGRFLTVTSHGDFERFIRAMGRPAQGPELPDPVAPSPEAIQALTTAAARYGIEIVGPPLI